jgi:hypothetical protein
LIKVSLKINALVNMGAGRRFMPVLNIRPCQFDAILAYSGYRVGTADAHDDADSDEDDQRAQIIDTHEPLLSCMVCGDGNNADPLMQCGRCVRVVHMPCLYVKDEETC